MIHNKRARKILKLQCSPDADCVPSDLIEINGAECRQTAALAQPDKVLALKAAGVSRQQIQEQLGISRASYYRIVATA